MNDLKALFSKILQYLHQRRARHKKWPILKNPILSKIYVISFSM